MFLPQSSSSSSSRPSSNNNAQERKLAEERMAASLKPWVEKYRPKTIDEVTAQEHIVSVLKKTLLSSNLPHMLFYGPPGTGKTSTILALARQLFGPELIKTRVLELNASDERGINVVREKIKNFAKLAVTNPKVGYPCPPFKIIILDEADSMTQDAQSALRRIMEQYSKITRFCLVCNYVTRIIEPLASRCSKFRFRMLDTESTRKRLEMIAKAEEVEFEDGVLDTLIETSDGDLRRAITYLQSASRLHKLVASDSKGNKVTPESIVEISGVIPHRTVQDLAVACGLEEGGKSGFQAILEKVEDIERQGHSAVQVVLQLHDLIVSHPTLHPRVKAKSSILLAEADSNLNQGADEKLQLLRLATAIFSVVVESTRS